MVYATISSPFNPSDDASISSERSTFTVETYHKAIHCCEEQELTALAALEKKTVQSCLKKASAAVVKKSVQFAAAEEDSQQVLCTVKYIKKHSPSKKRDLWWSSQESDHLYTMNLEAAMLVEPEYREALCIAYESIETVETQASDVNMPFEAVQECAMARGLELALLPELHDMKMDHRWAVLDAQELYVGVENREEGEELIRNQSIKYAHASTLIAQKLALCDEQFAWNC